MYPSQGLQQHHTKPNTLYRVEEAKPEPETAAGERTGDRAARHPRDPVADAGYAPEHLSPARCTEADGEDGQEPGMASTELREEKEERRPDNDEEGQDEEANRPLGCCVGRPEVRPTASVGRAEEVVLQYYHDEEPTHKFPSEKCLVERGNLAWRLVVVRWQRRDEKSSNGEHKTSYRQRDHRSLW